MARVTTTPIQKRFSDVDSFLHVNNVSQQMYFDLGKTEYFSVILKDNVLEKSLRIITANTSTNYMQQIRWQDDVCVTTSVEKVGTKSITIIQRLLCGERVMTESRSVMVAFDFTEQVSVAVPQSWRTKLLEN